MPKEGTTFTFKKEKETRNTVRFEAQEDNCPVRTIYVQKWAILSKETVLELTLKPVPK